MITKETNADINAGINYAESQFKKVVDVTNQTSLELTLNYSDDLADFCIMSYLARIEGMIKSYKSHAFSSVDFAVYDVFLIEAYKAAEDAYHTETVEVSEGMKA